MTLGNLKVNRIGFGAMQLGGGNAFGPPADAERSRAVLRRAVELGVNHIDTSDYYGPYVVNNLIREALHPYPKDLVLVTKVGAKRDDAGNWLPATTPDELRSAVHDNLRRLEVDAIDVVNLRIMDATTPVEEGFAALAELQQQGLVKHLGVSNVSSEQLKRAQQIAPVVCVQNYYNLAHREDDALVDECAAQDIAYVPFFPLGGFQPLHHERLAEVAARHDATPRQVALAWLLHRSPTILLIPGTSSVDHLEENLAAGGLQLSQEDIDAF
jgi:aryl-alcohol dehydrogenase-like predicted oxidoreductase